METKIEKAEKSIAELEAIVKSLYRSAANLDGIIEELKSKVRKYKETDDEWWLSSSATRYYNDRSRASQNHGFSELNELEADIWARLLADTHEES